jgi:hypothetical protein
MDTALTYAIVRVIDDTTLVGPDSAEQEYLASRPLVPGTYLVLWRAAPTRGRYDQSALYFGPFASEDHAREWLRLLGKAQEGGTGRGAGPADPGPAPSPPVSSG